MIRRTAFALLAALGLVLLGPALAASAAPAPASVAAVGPLHMKACADAPEPSSPLSGLPGKLYDRPATATDADPFSNPNVKITDVYGYSYHWVNYDNGCVPGSGVGPGLTTSIANFGLAGGASVNAFVHGLLSLVVTPNFLAPLDQVLTSTTDAIKGGFWEPWVTVVLVIVAAAILIAASRANVSSVVTTAGWAGLVLVATTYVMSYPVSSAQAVDGLIQSTITTSARAIGTSNEVYGPPVPGSENANPAQAALDDMFDTINRDTLYNGWLEGVVGSSDSAIARTYGPDLFRASHLTWSEAETVENDPDAGKAIIDAKKDLWVKTAADIERQDSAAYQQLTGNPGRWDAAGTIVLRVGLMMPFLALAAVFIVLAYVVTRAFVPLAPGIGVFGMLYMTQGWVMAVLRNVGRFLVLGPAFFAGALANLVLDAAVLGSDLAFGLQLVICLAIPSILFKLLRPGSSIPGMGAARRLAREGMRGMLTRRAVRDGIDDANGKRDDVDDRSTAPRRNDGPVADTGPTPLRLNATVVGDPQREGTYRPRRDYAPAAVGAAGRHELARGTGSELPVAEPTSGARALPNRSRRELAAAGTGETTRELPAGRNTAALAAGQQRPTFLIAGGSEASARTNLDDATNARQIGPGLTTGPHSARPGADTMPAGAGNHPALTPDREDTRTASTTTGPTDEATDLSAPASTITPPAEVMRPSAPLPSGIVEANSRTVDGEQVFELWRPPTFDTANAGTDDEEDYR